MMSPARSWRHSIKKPSNRSKLWTIGEFREFLLDDATTGPVLEQLHRAIIPEIAAAVAKLMSNEYVTES